MRVAFDTVYFLKAADLLAFVEESTGAEREVGTILWLIK